MAEAVMMALAPTFGRLQAHDFVHELARACAENGKNFITEVRANPDVATQLPPATIDDITRPENYLGDAGKEIDRAILAARTVLNS